MKEVMTLMLSSSAVEWSRPLMIGWIVIALALSVIEVFWLTGGFSSRPEPAKQVEA